MTSRKTDPIKKAEVGTFIANEATKKLSFFRQKRESVNTG